MSRRFFDMYIVDHVHEGPTDCVGNLSIVPKQTIDAHLIESGRLVNVVHDPENGNIVGDMYDEEGHKVFTCTPIYENDDAMTVDEREEWGPHTMFYRLSAEPNWDKVPEHIKNDPEQLANLEKLQGQLDPGPTVMAFVNSPEVINVYSHEDGSVSGYDIPSQTTYTYHPVRIDDYVS